MNLGAYGTLPAVSPQYFTPGGRLTLQSGTPMIASDQASKSVVYYTHDQHAYFPVIKNGIIRPVYFPEELKLTLSAAHSANGIFDVFGLEQNGRGRIVTGPIWSTVTAGSGARGSGGGTTEHYRAAGLLVNRWGIPGLSAEGATFIPPLEGTYLGSLHIDGSNGQISCHVSYGQSRKWGVWNAYNRRKIELIAGDITASWSYNNTTLRQSRANSGNSLAVFSGLADENFQVEFRQNVSATVVSASGGVQVAVGWNSTTVASGFAGYAGNNGGSVGTEGVRVTLMAKHRNAPSLGVNNVNSCESAAGASTFEGGEINMRLSAVWNG